MRIWALVLATTVAGCGGETVGGPPQSPWPATGCPPSHELQNGRCAVREVYVPGGTFTMGQGSCPESGLAKTPPGFECLLADAPHAVTVAPFWVDATVYTWGEDPGPAGLDQPPYDDPQGCPTRGVECAPRLAYAPAPSDLGGLPPNPQGDGSWTDWQCGLHGKRAIREAEWEWVATWGGTRSYPWGEEEPTCERGYIDSSACELANPVEDHGFFHADGSPVSKVASHLPTPEGVYDLTGNVGEWVLPSSDEVYVEGYPSPIQKLAPCPDGEEFCGWHSKGWVLGQLGGWIDDPQRRFAGARRGANRNVHGKARAAAFRCVRPAG